jgi:UDP-N-acetylmuramyl pentapeptide phosphotransferase/UDP-N-acetylglucosamine-1-phosphate transferase
VEFLTTQTTNFDNKTDFSNGVSMVIGFENYVICVMVSFVASGLLVLLFQNFSVLKRQSFSGPQKIHEGFVPRFGGLAISASIFSTLIFFPNVKQSLFLLLTLAAMPALLAGLVEDFTGRVSARLRLWASLFVGVIFCAVTGYSISSVNIELIDFFLSVPIISMCLTILAIASLANSINIIDGLNGLAGSSTAFMTISFGFLASQSGDHQLGIICYTLAASCFGFLLLNFPFGKIFLGDGGAYFLGSLLATIAIIIPERNADISPFSSLLIVMYPFYELCRSFVRRILTSGEHIFRADNKHLHSLVFRYMKTRSNLSLNIQHSLSSLIMMTLPLTCCCWAIFFSGDMVSLVFGVFVFVIVYELLNFRMRYAIS